MILHIPNKTRDEFLTVLREYLVKNATMQVNRHIIQDRIEFLSENGTAICYCTYKEAIDFMRLNLEA